jgi:hypothetical protein
MSDWRDVGTTLLGTWPSQVASWGREAIAAYVAELQARGLTPDGAIAALRSREDRFPPSAGELAATARSDPSQPTFDEMLILLRKAMKAADPFERIGREHPLIGTFVQRQGWDRLRTLPLDDPDWGEKTRRDLEQKWVEHCDTTDSRQVASLASGDRNPRRLDPLSSLGIPKQIESAA